MTLLTAEDISHLATQPIPGDNPAGENVRLETAFEAIEQEIAKLDAFTTGDPVRWDDVRATCHQILQAESKDFLVACFLTRSLCEVDVLNGLNQGLLINKGLVEQFWDHAIPPKKRLRGRSQAFEWLVEKTHTLVDNYEPSPTELDIVKELESNLSELDALLVDKMGDHAPNMAEFRQAFRRMRQGLESEQEKPAEPTKPSAPNRPVANQTTPQSSAPSAPLPSGPGSVGSDKDLMAVYRLCQEQLRNASSHLAAKNSLDTEVFRINRFITWLGVSQLPPATQNKTQLRPVSKEKLDGYQALYQEKRWSDLIPDLEQSLVKAPFWLTGQRMAFEALQDLDAEGPMEMVRQGVKGFVTRLPDVVNLTFNDDSPFADEKTRQWIQGLGQSSGGGAAGATLTVDTEGLSQDWESAYTEAQALVREKKVREALALFQQGVSRSTSQREQALWRFHQARLCFECGMLELAVPLLENLDDQLVRQGVEEWEPQVSKRVLELLLRCYQQGERTDQRTQRIEKLHARLCKLDLALAFDLTTH